MGFSGIPVIEAVGAFTPASSFNRQFGGTGSTYSTALSAIASKADVLFTGTPAAAGVPGTTSATTGQVFVPTPTGSLLLISVVGAANNGTLSFRVWGWSRFDNGTQTTPPTKSQWTARPFALVAVTLGAKTGISGGLVTNTEVYADTMTVTTDYGVAPLGTRVVSGPSADDSTVWLAVDPLGSEFIELEGTLSDGTATAFDFLIRGVSGT